MPLIETCPFFLIDVGEIEEPYKSAGYSKAIEIVASDLQQQLAIGGYNGGTIPEHLQDCLDLTSSIKSILSSAGSSSCIINTNFEEIQKSQFNSFVAYLRWRFESLKNECNYAHQQLWNFPCKKITITFTFNMASNQYSYTSIIEDSNIVDSLKISEDFDMSSFSGQIQYEYYVKQSSGVISPELEEKINYLYDKNRELFDKTEEENFNG